VQCVRIPGGAVDNGAVAAWLRSSARTSRLRKRSTISLTTVISVARPTLTTSACGSSSSSSSSCALMDLCRTGIKPMHCDEQIARASMHASRAHRCMHRARIDACIARAPRRTADRLDMHGPCTTHARTTSAQRIGLGRRLLTSRWVGGHPMNYVCCRGTLIGMHAFRQHCWLSAWLARVCYCQ
jgi:hypothetical protein